MKRPRCAEKFGRTGTFRFLILAILGAKVSASVKQ
jgi:hypothetical protein